MKFNTEVSQKTCKETFAEAELNWDLERLYKNLATIKGKRLSPAEKRYLRGLLCGYSPRELADKLHKSPRGLEAFLSHTVYQYIKDLTGNQKMRNYRDISEWLENLSYKLPETPIPQSKGNSSPIEGIINIENSILYFDREKNTVNIDVHIHFEGTLPKMKGEDEK